MGVESRKSKRGSGEIVDKKMQVDAKVGRFEVDRQGRFLGEEKRRCRLI